MKQSYDEDLNRLIGEAGEYWGRTAVLLGRQLWERVRSTAVTIYGMGAVGTFTAEFLARSGFRDFELCDFDTLTPGSFNRLLTAERGLEGCSKAELAAERLRRIDPDIRVDSRELFVATQEAEKAFEPGAGRILVDAIDSLNPKVALLAAALQSGETVFSSMGAAGRRDPSRVKQADIWKTRDCPLAARVRRGLRRRGLQRYRLPTVFSDETPVPPLEAELLNGEEDRNSHNGVGRIRKVQASIVFLPGVFAANLTAMILDHLQRRE